MTNKCPKCQHENPDDTLFCGKCGTQLSSIEDIEVTKTIEAPKEKLTTGSTFADRYQIIEELGKGGMGKVYKVHDTKIKEKIALKLIKPEIAKDKKTIERFSNELRLARKIRHKNICQMFDLGEERGTHFITMEFVPGQDLKGLIRQSGQLAMGTTINIAKQICHGLTEAHKSGVVHRDLKPSNIMIDKQGDVRVMDFGIARSLETKGITGAGVMIGTPEYMSPEQVEGKEVDQRSDIYSLGVILYEMVTGRVPFEGDTPFTIGMKHKGEMPQNPKELNTQITDDLNKVILRCLEKDKENRFQSTGELYKELENIERGIPTTEKVIPKKKSLTSKEVTVTFSLKKLLIPTIVVLVAVIAVLMIWSPWSKDKEISVPTDRPSIAVLPFENNTGDENQDQLRDSLSDQLTADLYQSKYLYVKSASHVYGILKRLSLLQAEKFSFEDLRAIANQGGVSHLLTGSYTEDKDTFLITVTINRMESAQDAPSFTVDGPSTGNISALVDDITKRIKAELNLSQTQIASDIDREVARITSSSTESLKLYADARRKHYELDYPGAIQLFKKAIAIDPEFAMAYRGMFSSYWAIAGYPNKARDLLREALDLGERLPERERLQIKGDLALYSWKLDEAVAAFTELLELHPDDPLAHYSLSLAYRRMGEKNKEIEILRKAIQYKPELTSFYTRLAKIYRSQGLPGKADETIRLYVDNFGYHPIIHRKLAGQFLDQGDFDLALSEINKALSLLPTYPGAVSAKGDIHFYRGELDKAEEEYRKLLQQEEAAYYSFGLSKLADLYSLQGKFEAAREKVKEGVKRAQEAEEKRWLMGWHMASAYIEYISGNFEQALKALDRYWNFAVELRKLGDQSYCLCFRGLVYLEMASVDSAQETADELQQFMEQNKTVDISYYDFLSGSIELERGNYSRAISFFEKALVNSETFFLYSYSTALAYYGTGDLEKAQKEWEKILSPTLRSYGIGYPGFLDLNAKSYYMLGKIYERKGWPGKAIEHYEKFLNLWKDADPGLPEVEDARKRLVGLKSQ